MPCLAVIMKVFSLQTIFLNCPHDWTAFFTEVYTRRAGWLKVRVEWRMIVYIGAVISLF